MKLFAFSLIAISENLRDAGIARATILIKFAVAGLWLGLQGVENVQYDGYKVVACDLSALGCRPALFRQTHENGIQGK